MMLAANALTVFLPPPSEPATVDGAPADSHSLSRSRIKALVLDGCLRENETIITDPSAGIKPRAVYQLAVPKPSDPTPQGEAIALDILFEDEHLIVINKPAGMVVHPAPAARREHLSTR